MLNVREEIFEEYELNQKTIRKLSRVFSIISEYLDVFIYEFGLCIASMVMFLSTNHYCASDKVTVNYIQKELFEHFRLISFRDPRQILLCIFSEF